MNKNDKNLTSFILGELDSTESQKVKDAAYSDRQIATELKELQKTVSILDEVYNNPSPKLTAEQRMRIFSTATENNNSIPFPTKNSHQRKLKIAFAAIAAVLVTMFSLKHLSGVNHNTDVVANFEQFDKSHLTARFSLPDINEKTASRGTTTGHTLSPPKLTQVIANFPSQFRSTTLDIRVNEKQATSISENSLSSSRYVILPLTSGLSNVTSTLNSIRNGITPKGVRNEELVNYLPSTSPHKVTHKEINASLEFAPCHWSLEENSILAVIQISNNSKKTVKNVALSLKYSDTIISSEILGYAQSTTEKENSIQSPLSFNIEAGHYHTIVTKLNFNTLPHEASSLAQLDLSINGEMKKISYDFSKEALPYTSHAANSAAILSYWTTYINAKETFQVQHKYSLLSRLTKTVTQGDREEQLYQLLIKAVNQ